MPLNPNPINEPATFFNEPAQGIDYEGGTENSALLKGASALPGSAVANKAGSFQDKTQKQGFVGTRIKP